MIRMMNIMMFVVAMVLPMMVVMGNNTDGKERSNNKMRADIKKKIRPMIMENVIVKNYRAR